MNSVIKKIEMRIYDPDQRHQGILDYFLKTISFIYSLIVRFRLFLFDKNIYEQKQLSCPVISIGNVTLGGSGKTPLTIKIAKLLENLSYSVVIISRGYKSEMERSNAIVRDKKKILLSQKQAGDEPFMMAHKLSRTPIVIGQNRRVSGQLAIDLFNPDVIIMDDGFQHRHLARDLDIVLCSQKLPFGNGYLFPRGPLREPLTALQRCHTIIWTGSLDDQEKAKVEEEYNLIKPQFHVSFESYAYLRSPGQKELLSFDEHLALGLPMEKLKDKRVVAFSGLAQNKRFINSLNAHQINTIDSFDFPDHFDYPPNALEKIYTCAQAKNADYLVTTEKDFVKLRSKREWPIDMVVMGIDAQFGVDEANFLSFLTRIL